MEDTQDTQVPPTVIGQLTMVAEATVTRAEDTKED